MNNDKLESLKDGLFRSLTYNRIAEGRRYCKSIIEKDRNKSYLYLYNRLEGLKKSNGRYQDLNTLELKLNFINSIIKYEINTNQFYLCYDERFIEFCYSILRECKGEFWEIGNIKDCLFYLKKIPKNEAVKFDGLEKLLNRLLGDVKLRIKLLLICSITLIVVAIVLYIFFKG